MRALAQSKVETCADLAAANADYAWPAPDVRLGLLTYGEIIRASVGDAGFTVASSTATSTPVTGTVVSKASDPPDADLAALQARVPALGTEFDIGRQDPQLITMLRASPTSNTLNCSARANTARNATRSPATGTRPDRVPITSHRTPARSRSATFGPSSATGQPLCPEKCRNAASRNTSSTAYNRRAPTWSQPRIDGLTQPLVAQ